MQVEFDAKCIRYEITRRAFCLNELSVYEGMGFFREECRLEARSKAGIRMD
jgi:hypothetical protein